MRRPPELKRPRTAPLRSFTRPSDGALVEVWVRKRVRRSRDLVLHGTEYFQAICAVGGCMAWEDTSKRNNTPEEALAIVVALFERGQSN